MSKTVALAVVFGFAVCAPSLIRTTSDDLRIEWTRKTRPPEALGNLAVAVLDDTIHVLGGRNYSDSDTKTYHFAYDPRTDRWTKKADLLFPHDNHAAVVVAGRIYVIGGNASPQKVEVYDPAADAWRELPPLPTPRQHINYMAAAIADRIHVVGGVVNKRDGAWPVTGRNEVYSTAERAWRAKSPLPAARQLGVLTAVGNGLFMIGGTGADFDDTRDVFVYDPERDSWTKGADMPEARSLTGSAVIRDKIFVVTGIRRGQLNMNVFVYDPESDSWSRATPPPATLNLGAVAAVRNRLYVIGGEYCLEGTLKGF